ncbi:HERV-H LTR-associating protein 2 [Aythya fuligula]|uniref:HERV-H LTR-associating protein 2 n=1 Tax=Aythya fuligula TaxID=219594 RepID=A0A6J3E216_AYTFU|nr:HERV-H LTR-associating protein 2 [Aythya fuligula]
MKRQKIPSLLCLLSICATTWEKETVTGLFAKDVILPCPFPPGDDEVIYWKKEENDVHSYYYRRDHLESQHLNYRNRTQVFNEHIPHGNASLKLRNLTLTDKGLYLCYVGTQQTKTEVEVELHVQVASYYALEYHKNDTERMLTCSAFLTYPEPNITWVIGNKPIQETRREETRDGILYSLRSHQSIITTSDPYSCHIHLPQGRWTAEWRMKDQLAKAEGSSVAIPCEFSSDTLHREGISVVWILNRNSVTSVLAAFNGTSHSYQPRVRINQSDCSLLLSDLTTSDSGEYLCNMSTPHYTKLTVRTLEVEHSDNTWITVTRIVLVVIVLAVIGLAAIGVYLCRKRIGITPRCRGSGVV